MCDFHDSAAVLFLYWENLVMHILHLILELFHGASIWIQIGKNHVFIKESLEL